MIPVLHGAWEGSLRVSWREAFTHWVKLREGLFAGFVTGVMLCIAIIAGLWLLLHILEQWAHVRSVLIHWGLSVEWFGLFFGYIVIVNSLLEELLWRGFLLQRLERAVAPLAAMVISSCCYALYHVIIATVMFGRLWGIIITIAAFFIGMMWAYMKRRYPSIYATWISHLFADLGIMLALSWWVF
jgi:membrane protease YdiL (CAAX protease family)